MRVVIVGNGVAAHACATVLSGGGAEVTVIGPGPMVDRPPLSKAALRTGEPPLLAPVGAERLDGVTEAVDGAGRRALVDGRWVAGDALVLAVGLDYAPPFEASVNATPAGLRAVAAQLAAGPRSVVIAGGGLIGVETAATLAGLGHSVTVLDLEPRPLHRLHDPIPALAAATLDELGVTFLGSTPFDRSAVHETDLVIAATGGRQRPGFPLEVDGAMRVGGVDGVFAIGDCARPLHARFGRLVSPHWTQAVAGGLVAARTILGEDVVLDELPYWWSDIGPRRLDEVGHAAAAETWAIEDDLHVGRDAAGEIACVLVVDAPRRLREARRPFG